MYDLYEKIYSLCELSGISISKMCSEAGISRGAVTDLKMGRSKSLSANTLTKISTYFNISVDDLLGTKENNTQKETPTLTKKDERDISKKLDETLKELELNQDGLMFDGEPLDDLTKELLIQSIRNGLELSKKLAKEKYTPKKYK